MTAKSNDKKENHCNIKIIYRAYKSKVTEKPLSATVHLLITITDESAKKSRKCINLLLYIINFIHMKTNIYRWMVAK